MSRIKPVSGCICEGVSRDARQVGPEDERPALNVDDNIQYAGVPVRTGERDSQRLGEPEAAAGSCTPASSAFSSTHTAPAGHMGSPRDLQPLTDCIIVIFFSEALASWAEQLQALYIDLPMGPAPLEGSRAPGTVLKVLGAQASLVLICISLMT